MTILPVGYTTADVVYQWTAGRGVNIASDMKLSQFDLIKTPTGNATIEVNKGKTFFDDFRLINPFLSQKLPPFIKIFES